MPELTDEISGLAEPNRAESSMPQPPGAPPTPVPPDPSLPIPEPPTPPSEPDPAPPVPDIPHPEPDPAPAMLTGRCDLGDDLDRVGELVAQAG